MSHTPRFRKLLLPTLIASALSGCGGSDNDNNQPDPGPSAAFKLCHDTNLDGLCSANENPQTFDTLKKVQAASVGAGSGPVIVRENNNLMVASNSAATASAWSTLVHNEGFVNPNTGSDEAAIASYLKGKLALESDSGLSESETAAFMASIRAALSANPDANPYSVIGAVIDAAVARGSLENAVPDAAQITSQRVLPRDFDTEVTPANKVNWETSDHDERVALINVDGESDKILVVNRWFNRIAVVDATAADLAVETQPFAAMYTAGHHEYTTKADYVSGASEHRITQSWLADDGDTLYALVTGPREVDVPEDDSYGLFRVPLTDGQVPTFMVTSIDGTTELNVPHRSPEVKRIASKSLDNAIQLDSGDILAYDDEAGYVRFYNKMLDEDTSRAFPLDRDLEGWTLADNGATLVTLQGPAEGSKGRLLQSYNTSNLSGKNSLEFSGDADLLPGSKTSNRVVVLEPDAVHVINTSDLSVISSTPLANEASSISRLSPDGSRAALVVGKEIRIMNLTDAYPFIEGSVKPGGRLRALAFNGNDEILYSARSGKLSSISLSGLTSSTKDITSLLEEALDEVDGDSINHNYPLDAVIYDMNLPTNFGAVSYNWNSTLGNALDLSAPEPGVISQSDAAVSGTLTVSSSYTFRGETSTSEAKSMELTIRPASEIRDHIVTTLTGAHANHSMSHLAATPDGQTLAAYTSGDDGQGSGIVIFTRQPDNTVSYRYGGDAAISLPDGYEDSRVDVMTWNQGLLRVVVREAVAAGAKDGNGIARVLTLDPVAGTWEIGSALPGKGAKAAVSQDGSVLALWLHIPAGGDAVAVKVITLNTDDLSEIKTVDVDGDPAFWAFTVNNAGDQIMAYYNFKNEEGKTVRTTRRYDADTTGEPDAETVIKTATYFYSYDNPSDRLVTGDFSANLRVYQPVADAADLNSFTEFATARGRYDGVHNGGGGRMYYGAVKGSVAYVWSSDRGLVAVDISNPANIREVFYAPFEDTGAGVVVPDANVAFSTGFSDDQVSTIGVLPLN
ncbi:MAG: hypothetical protein CSA52_01515 [Gammaproteobacteria bacterium]|nr:MAG: hypothetical protein CSB48_09405 [Pseudomonadota bacterium]PIE38650.1 MAG: hypothetical protein CSA52_01515 [Gammaproteobacteria bacterium]